MKYWLFALLNFVYSYPNIILYLADDLGKGEILRKPSIYNFSLVKNPSSEYIPTPNIDKLSKSGVLFGQVWGAALCAPSRFMLLTGKTIEKSSVKGNNFTPQKIDLNMSFPNVLKRLGYKTAVIGKYGFGVPKSYYSADKMGFDFFYGYGTHIQAHYPFPRFVYKNNEIINFPNNATIFKNKMFWYKKMYVFPRFNKKRIYKLYK